LSTTAGRGRRGGGYCKEASQNGGGPSKKNVIDMTDTGGEEIGGGAIVTKAKRPFGCITHERNGNTWVGTITIRGGRDPGSNKTNRGIKECETGGEQGGKRGGTPPKKNGFLRNTRGTKGGQPGEEEKQEGGEVLIHELDKTASESQLGRSLGYTEGHTQK